MDLFSNISRDYTLQNNYIWYCQHLSQANSFIVFRCCFGFENPLFLAGKFNSGSIETNFFFCFYVSLRQSVFLVPVSFFGFRVFFGFHIFTLDQNTKQRFKLMKSVR